MESTTSLRILFISSYDSTTGVFTVPLVVMESTTSLSYLFPDMTAQQGCSQFPLVEMESTTSLPILFISRYDSTTGVFTVPPGGDGIYYFSVYVLVQNGEAARFDITVNDDEVCTTYPDQNATTDLAPGSCSAVVDVVAGKGCSIISTLRQFKTF